MTSTMITPVYNFPKFNTSLRMPGLIGASTVGRIDPTKMWARSTTLAPRQNIDPNTGLVKMVDTSTGKVYEDPSSARFKDTSSDRKLIIPDKPLPNIRPALDVLNLALANRNINKIKKTQLARKNTYYQTPSLSVRPVTDLPPEVLAAQADALSQVRSTDASSDPAVNLLSKNMASAQRNKMRNEQIAGRATAMLVDRNRFDEQHRQNQQAAAETANKNLDREQDFADYKTGVETAALEAKGQLTANYISGVGKDIGLAAEYNTEAASIADANARQDYNDDLKYAASLPTEGERRKAELAARDKYAGYTAQRKLNYNTSMASGLDNTFLGKLLTGTLRKP